MTIAVCMGAWHVQRQQRTSRHESSSPSSSNVLQYAQHTLVRPLTCVRVTSILPSSATAENAQTHRDSCGAAFTSAESFRTSSSISCKSTRQVHVIVPSLRPGIDAL